MFVGEVEEGLVGEKELHVLLESRRVLPPYMFRVQGAGCRVQGAGFRVQPSEC